MEFKTDVLYLGFPGKLTNAGLGWGAVALIRDGKHNILFDTGGPGIRGTLKKMLAQHQLEYKDIDIVILSHLHWDHAYNVDYFPQARFVLAQAEWEEAGRLNPKDIFMEEKAIPFLRSLKTKLITKDGEEIVPGLTSLLIPGHTPGSLGALLETGSAQKWLFTGDACKNRGELLLEDAGQAFDTKLAAESLRKMKKIADRILPGHDGWIGIGKNGELSPEGGNDVTFVFEQGLTVNGGQSRLTIHID
jgi:glyoxylase-like metal-dependent hydrolase (beta-lactamase superfamily II)